MEKGNRNGVVDGMQCVVVRADAAASSASASAVVLFIPCLICLMILPAACRFTLSLQFSAHFFALQLNLDRVLHLCS
jgi:hypothetical protein